MHSKNFYPFRVQTKQNKTAQHRVDSLGGLYKKVQYTSPAFLVLKEKSQGSTIPVLRPLFVLTDFVVFFFLLLFAPF